MARTTSRRHARWAAAQATYNYTISYRKGASNGKPDAVFRRPDYLPPPLPSLPILSPADPLLHTLHLIGAAVLLLQPPPPLLPSSPPPRSRGGLGMQCDRLCNHKRVARGASRGVRPRTAEWQPIGQVWGSTLSTSRRPPLSTKPPPHSSNLFCPYLENPPVVSRLSTSGTIRSGTDPGPRGRVLQVAGASHCCQQLRPQMRPLCTQ